MTATCTLPAARVHGVLADYFVDRGVDVEHPFTYPHIAETYTPDSRGWQTLAAPVPFSRMALVKLRNDGVRAVVISAGGYHPDFGVLELIRASTTELDAEFLDAL
jgi:hypothetical protein